MFLWHDAYPAADEATIAAAANTAFAGHPEFVLARSIERDTIVVNLALDGMTITRQTDRNLDGNVMTIVARCRVALRAASNMDHVVATTAGHNEINSIPDIASDGCIEYQPGHPDADAMGYIANCTRAFEYVSEGRTRVTTARDASERELALTLDACIVGAVDDAIERAIPALTKRHTYTY